MYSLGMLPEIVEAGETPRAVALKRAFTSVLPDLGISIRRIKSKGHIIRGHQAYLMCLAKCSLLVKLKLHGG